MSKSSPILPPPTLYKAYAGGQAVIVRADILQSVDGRRVAEQLVREGTLTQGFGELHVNLEADTFKALVFYLNNRQLHCSEIHLPDLLAEATRLNLPGLVALCEQKLATGQALRKINNNNDDQSTTLSGGTHGHEVTVSAAMSNVLVADAFAEADTASIVSNEGGTAQHHADHTDTSDQEHCATAASETDTVSTVNNEDGTAQHHADRSDTSDQGHSATEASASALAIEVMSEPFQGRAIHDENAASQVDGGQTHGTALVGPLEEAEEQNGAAKSQSMAMRTQHDDKDDSSQTTPGSTPSDGSPSTGGSASSLTSSASTSNGCSSTETDGSELSRSQAAESCRTGFSASTRSTSAGERFREAVARRLNILPAESSTSNISRSAQAKPQAAADDSVYVHQQETDSIESSSATAPAVENRRVGTSVLDHSSSEKSAKAHVWRSTGERYKDYFWRRMNESNTNTSNDSSSAQVQPQSEAVAVHDDDAESQAQGTVSTQSTDIISATATATASGNRSLVTRVPGITDEQQTAEPDQRSHSGEQSEAAVARRLNCAAAAESRISSATQDEPQASPDVGARPSLRERARQRCNLYAPTSGRNQSDAVEKKNMRSKETTATTHAAATVDNARSINIVQGPCNEQHPDDPNQAVISVKEVIEHFEAVNVAISSNNRSVSPVHSVSTRERPHPPWAMKGKVSTRRPRGSTHDAQDPGEAAAAPPTGNVVRERGRPATRVAQRSTPAAATTGANRVVHATANGSRQRAPVRAIITIQSLYGQAWDSNEGHPELPAQGMHAIAANVAPVATVESDDVFSDDASSDADIDIDQTYVRGPRGIHSTGRARQNPRTEPDRELMW